MAQRLSLSGIWDDDLDLLERLRIARSSSLPAREPEHVISPKMLVPDDAPSVRGVIKQKKGQDTMDKFELEMITTTRGKDDEPEAKVLEYRAGETYKVGPQLYKAFVVDSKPPVAKPAGKKPKAADMIDPDPGLGSVPLATPANEMETKEHGPNEPRRRGR